MVVGAGNIKVCEAMRTLANTNSDAAPVLKKCIRDATAGTIVEIPRGIYRINSQIKISNVPITLRTEGKSLADPRCTVVNHDCAELVASTAFVDALGILFLSVPGTVVDHIVINGNKDSRVDTFSGEKCKSASNSYGYNIRVACSQCAVMNSVTKNALCGTG